MASFDAAPMQMHDEGRGNPFYAWPQFLAIAILFEAGGLMR